MSHSDHINVRTCREILHNVFDMGWIKATGAIILCGYDWIVLDNRVLVAVYLLIIFDTITGLLLACKRKEVSSGGFFRVAMKCCMYFILILTGRLVDKVVPYAFAASIIESFLAVTEGLSIMENLSGLGFPVPIKLVKMLKKYSQSATDKK